MFIVAGVTAQPLAGPVNGRPMRRINLRRADELRCVLCASASAVIYRRLQGAESKTARVANTRAVLNFE